MDTESRITCLIGSGVVERPWDPVLEALADCGVTDAESGNAFMARVVQLARLGCAKRLADKPDACAKLKQGVIDVAASINERLGHADECGRQQVRAEFARIIETFASAADNVHFATPNWDGAVHRALIDGGVDCGAFHFHGRVGTGGPLYLPSETADELYRADGQQKEFVDQHQMLMNTIDKSTRLVLYGISLSPLDAELAQILASGMHEAACFREIVIVDPCHRRVATILRTMLPRFGPAIAITGYHPRDTRVAASTDYSLSARPPAS